MPENAANSETRGLYAFPYLTVSLYDSVTSVSPITYDKWLIAKLSDT